MRRPVDMDGTCPHSFTLRAGLFKADGVPENLGVPDGVLDDLGVPAIEGVEGARRCWGDAVGRCGGIGSEFTGRGAGALSLFFFLNNEKPMMLCSVMKSKDRVDVCAIDLGRSGKICRDWRVLINF